MMIAVHFFARARELAGTGELDVTLPVGATVADLRVALVERIPAMRDLLGVSRIAVNHEFAADAIVLMETDEVAIIPPVSGG